MFEHFTKLLHGGARSRAAEKKERSKNKQKKNIDLIDFGRAARVGNQSKYFMRANGPAFVVMKCAPATILFLFSAAAAAAAARAGPAALNCCFVAAAERERVREREQARR